MERRLAAVLERQMPRKIFARIYLEEDCEEQQVGFTYFGFDENIRYCMFFDDFGPMNLGMVHRFCDQIDEILCKPGNSRFVLTTSRNSRDRTNAVFLLGAYMIMQLSAPVNAVLNLLEFTLPSCLAYRDVSRGPPTFKLHLRDCWEGLYQAKELGWADLSPEGMDLDEYETLDNPLNADLHEVIRGKFIAMLSPRSLPNGNLWIDGPDRFREFAPAHYAGIIQQLGARTIVRLNEARYDASEFEAVGIAVVDIPFDDCTVPPPSVVAKFLLLVEAIQEPIAVHCSAGLGRTGTLIGLYAMKHHDLTARQAIGWLRIVRPGSVMGQQQQYLCRMEGSMRRAGAAYRARAGPKFAVSVQDAGAAARPWPAAVAALMTEVSRDVDERVRAIEAKISADPRRGGGQPAPACTRLVRREPGNRGSAAAGSVSDGGQGASASCATAPAEAAGEPGRETAGMPAGVDSTALRAGLSG